MNTTPLTFKLWVESYFEEWLNDQNTQDMPKKIENDLGGEIIEVRFLTAKGMPFVEGPSSFWRICACFMKNHPVGYVVVPRKFWNALPGLDGFWQDYPCLDQDYSKNGHQNSFAEVVRDGGGIRLIKKGKVVRA